ncbi:ChaN family lipoprotein [Geobacter sp. DSM 9736]|uniref:ChaN family lipoprotein n=1 Tax=Geobacter sp. DSM 9736 TaxID=1277350 RepID=UPI000B510A7A|nr:ChaN family lipoprotein [Geobacter sp. DSM 9736]SNB47698.1 Uncharacterized iron-regulated protein [Geobacter sp. DSM 9736]
MNSPLRLALLTAACLILICAGACFSSERVLRVKDGKVISFQQMIDDISGTSVILVGENHDDEWHHAQQLAVIKALHERGGKVAVGLEMFTAENQGELDRWIKGQKEEDEFIRLYYHNWKMPWPLYRDILLYARRNSLPLVGLNIPPEVSSRVAEKGFASLSAEEKRRLPPEITCNVDPAYMAFIRRAFSAHGHGDLESFVHFCETQKLWNRSMAWYLLGYLKKEPARQVVVVTGAGHAVKQAVPAELSDLSKLSYVVILPQTGEMPVRQVTAEDADYILLK